MAFLAGALLASSSAAAAADEPPICADRPGKSSQACTVPAGHFQFESSLADWTLDKHDGERDTSLVLAQTGLKFGLTSNTHIEITINPWQRATSRLGAVREQATGFGDVLASYKYRLTAPDGALQVALSQFVKIPTAKHSLGNGKWEGGLLIPIQYAIPKTNLALSLTPEVDWNADSDGHGYHLATAQVANLGWQITPKLNLSGEVWTQWDWDPAGTTRQYSADGAVAYLLSKKTQLDAGINIGLNRVTPDVDIYVGWAQQF